MRIAHISDLHILDLAGIRAGRFLNRRLLGGVNLALYRRGQYRTDILERLIEDILREGVDHVAITGDLSNLALESEFERVFHLVKLLGGYDRVSVVPGNHDCYTGGAIAARRFEKYFHGFMYQGYTDLKTVFYPYQKVLGDVLLVGLNSACHTTPPMSYGTIGARQLDALDRLLAAPRVRTLRKIVLLHHALHRRPWHVEATTRLVNRENLLRVLVRNRVDLALYGHDHAGRIWELDEAGHRLHLVNCGSSTRLGPEPEHRARYRIVHLDAAEGVRRIETKLY
ncbi:MAG: metallophosphoesterase, partial [Deltaproteobacteria bacterium]|nr:metallophosphoesterase [Deltaproteobacteria bacterium]